MSTLTTRLRKADRGRDFTRDTVFFGPYICRVDRSICVPKGDAGLFFMRDFIRDHGRPREPGRPAFTEGFVGFVTYEGDAHFVYVDEVLDLTLCSPLGAFQASATSQRRTLPSRRAPLSNLTKHEYFEKIARIKEYLFAGDTYQVNFSQKFELSYDGSALALYQKLTEINPSPHQFFMETPEFAVISNSPERLFKILNAPGLARPRRSRTAAQPFMISTQPIKGTVPRGKTPKEDAMRIAELLASKKDAAELAMIVDLERNDLGKICETGTVEVMEKRAIEKYSHVIHTVANIRGVLRPELDWLDALCALFPGGSVTGAPKKRTMEIIAELEKEPRGVYCGSAGWIDISGACDFNILIRTLWCDKNAKRLTWRSGGGIVVDSDPQKEYEETLHKAAAITKAVIQCSSHDRVFERKIHECPRCQDIGV